MRGIQYYVNVILIFFRTGNDLLFYPDTWAIVTAQAPYNIYVHKLYRSNSKRFICNIEREKSCLIVILQYYPFIIKCDFKAI